MWVFARCGGNEVVSCDVVEMQGGMCSLHVMSVCSFPAKNVRHKSSDRFILSKVNRSKI